MWRTRPAGRFSRRLSVGLDSFWFVVKLGAVVVCRGPHATPKPSRPTIPDRKSGAALPGGGPTKHPAAGETAPPNPPRRGVPPVVAPSTAARAVLLVVERNFARSGTVRSTGFTDTTGISPTKRARSLRSALD